LSGKVEAQSRPALGDFETPAYNPRKISAEAMEGLKTSLRTFGDLSGFVVNRRTGHVICANQRRKALGEGALAAVAWGEEHQVELGAPGDRFTSSERWGVLEAEGGARFPVREVDWTESFEKAANVTANNSRIMGEWTEGAGPLLEEISLEYPDLFVGLKLPDLTLDLEALGFCGAQDGDEDEDGADDVPEPPDEAVTRTGDVWRLGNHRLMCGDSSKPEDLSRLLDGARIHLVNTDPPYNVKVEPRSNNAIAAGLSSFVQSDPNLSEEFKRNAMRGGEQKPRAKDLTHHQKHDLSRRPGASAPTHAKLRPKDRPLENDFVTDEEFDALLRAWFGNIARALAPGRSFYVWGGYANCANYPSALAESDLYFSQTVIWVKEHPVLTRKDFMGNHEWCFYGWRKGAGHWFNPEINNATDVWSVKKVNPTSMIHLTEKPVGLASRAILYSSKPGENILDLFGGSGSTLIAAEKAGRRAYLMEIDTLYCDVILQRWADFTGKDPIREDGTSWGELRKALSEETPSSPVELSN